MKRTFIFGFGLIVLLFILNVPVRAAIFVPTAQLTIVSTTNGEDVLFHFDLRQVSGALLNDYRQFDLQTQGNSVSVSTVLAFPGTTRYVLSEVVPDDWGLESPTCVSDTPDSVFTSDEKSVSISTTPNSHVTCTFHNAKITSPPVCITNCNSNVLFLPGIEGSRLFSSGLLGENQIWEPDSLTSHDIDTLDLTNSSSADSVYAKEGDVVDQAYGIYDIYDTFMSKLDQLREGGAIRDWAPIAYDWRLDYQELLTNGNKTSGNKIYYHGANAATSTPYIIQKLRELAESSKTGKVTIIAHSNGGLLAKALLMQPDSAQYVDKMILVASPQLGTPQAVGSLLNGFNAGLPSLANILFLSDANARTLGQNMPMVYNLLPSASYFQNGGGSVITFNPSLKNVADWAARYSNPFNPSAGIDSESGLKRFMTDTMRSPQPTSSSDLNVPIVANASLFANAVGVHTNLDAWTPPEGVDVVTVAGWGELTLQSIEYTQKISSGLAPNTITYTPKFSTHGDGTVLSSSASWMSGGSGARYWVNLAAVNVGSGKIYQHANILEAPNVEDLITSLLTNAPTAFLPNNISTFEPTDSNTSNTYFILHSPLTLGFMDASGKYAGATASSTVSNIPNVRYERFGEVQWLSVPKNLAGTVIMQGMGSGSFSLDVEEVSGGVITATTTFAAVPTATTTVASISITPNQPLASTATLNVDANGDGDVDSRLYAKLNTTVLPDTTPPEVRISVDPATRDLSIVGIDDVSSTTMQKSSSAAAITDASGNTTTLVFQKSYSNKFVTYARLASIQYSSATTTPLSSSFAYVWDTKGVLVSQAVVVDKQTALEALYSKAKDKTTVLVLQKNTPIKTQTVAGLAIIKLTTSKGSIQYSW